ncbi:hypothetical protein L596_009887 [Steinernema carpocapsae]|uniref:Uncharacterized protein n=1 Tax=Steinernema carpocapsae TaxID=34508 RepID=A0A4U5PHG5_STECR|nr:hypothetical protein L596_009887 [Steinernema carpocapsae]
MAGIIVPIYIYFTDLTIILPFLGVIIFVALNRFVFVIIALIYHSIPTWYYWTFAATRIVASSTAITIVILVLGIVFKQPEASNYGFSVLLFATADDVAMIVAYKHLYRNKAVKERIE